jgi:tetratricopeptide (TPR) repeat protein
VRFRLLEPIRAFAMDRLEEAGEIDATRDRHAAVFLRWAEAASPDVHSRDPTAALRRLEADHDNLRAALERSLARGRAEDAARLLWPLWALWWTRGHFAEGRRWSQRVLDRRGDLTDGSLGRALTVSGVMGYGLGRYAELPPPLEEALTLLLRIGDRHGAAVAMSALGLALFRIGEIERGERLLEEAAGRLRAVGDDGRAAQILTLLGVIPFNRGDYRLALARFEEGLELARACADPRALCVSLFDIGLAKHALGDLDAAGAAYREGLIVARELGEPSFAAHLVEGMAGLAASAGDRARAARLFGGARAELAALEIAPTVRASERAFLDRHLARARAASDDATWARAWDQGATLSGDELVAEALGEEAGKAQ